MSRDEIVQLVMDVLTEIYGPQEINGLAAERIFNHVFMKYAYIKSDGDAELIFLDARRKRGEKDPLKS